MSDALKLDDGLAPSSRSGGDAPGRRSLKQMLLHGSSWTMFEYGGSQALRLVSNIVLARHFIDPQAYGVMGIVLLFTTALDLFSDIGLGPSIIQHPRGEEKRFLNTAWTMQAARGVLLSLCAVAIAWPAAVVYREPLLMTALPVAALSSAIGGFNSMNLHLLNRQVRLARLAFINLGAQAIAIVGTIAIAAVTRSVWALIAGSLLASFLKLVASHLFCPGPRHAFCWDRTATDALFRFGKWIFFSTAFWFVSSRGDQAILGWYLTDKAEFGQYFIAAMLSGALANGVYTIASRVLFPVYARVAEDAPGSLRAQTLRMRGALIALTVPPACVLAIWGREIVQLLYRRPEYYDAGWMLQIVAVGTVGAVVTSTIGPVLLARGDSYRFMIVQVSRATIMCVTMIACGAIGGWTGIEKGTQIGLIVGVALPEYIVYPVLVWAVRPYGVWLPKLDFAAVAAAGVVIAIGLSL
ncbi:MAG: hypothetical protein FJY92_01895 [Candidatus Hydrogenedentes bacterium]|nr:hypothetical protein [Candidatus Hydrogenedentota bacterium]